MFCFTATNKHRCISGIIFILDSAFNSFKTLCLKAKVLYNFTRAWSLKNQYFYCQCFPFYI